MVLWQMLMRVSRDGPYSPETHHNIVVSTLHTESKDSRVPGGRA